VNGQAAVASGCVPGSVQAAGAQAFAQAAAGETVPDFSEGSAADIVVPGLADLFPVGCVLKAVGGNGQMVLAITASSVDLNAIADLLRAQGYTGSAASVTQGVYFFKTAGASGIQSVSAMPVATVVADTPFTRLLPNARYALYVIGTS
jgi:hypothetical protein